MVCLTETLGILGACCCLGLLMHFSFWDETDDCCFTCEVCGLCLTNSKFREKVCCSCS